MTNIIEQVSAERQNHNEEVDLSKLINLLWRKKLLILIVTFIFTVSSVIYSLRLSDIYRSEIVLAVMSDSGGMSLPGQLGGLAALAGVNFGSLGKNGDKSALALEVLKSRDFIGRFIKKHDLIIPLIGAKAWDRTTNSLVFDNKLFNADQQVWVRDVKPPFTAEPSLLEAYDVFMKRFNIVHDKTSGMVRLNLSHYSPFLAQEWLTALVADINEEMRLLELTEAQRSIDYLNQQVNQTNLADVRSALFSLVEEQTKTLMLANVRKEFVFQTVDAAYLPEKKAAPQRALIVVLSSLLGIILASTFVLFRYLSYRPRSK